MKKLKDEEWLTKLFNDSKLDMQKMLPGEELVAFYLITVRSTEITFVYTDYVHICGDDTWRTYVEHSCSVIEYRTRNRGSLGLNPLCYRFKT